MQILNPESSGLCLLFEWGSAANAPGDLAALSISMVRAHTERRSTDYTGEVCPNHASLSIEFFFWIKNPLRDWIRTNDLFRVK
jgi:hypothetical protein